jgi:hypothetical protein
MGDILGIRHTCSVWSAAKLSLADCSILSAWPLTKPVGTLVSTAKSAPKCNFPMAVSDAPPPYSKADGQLETIDDEMVFGRRLTYNLAESRVLIL